MASVVDDFDAIGRKMRELTGERVPSPSNTIRGKDTGIAQQGMGVPSKAVTIQLVKDSRGLVQLQLIPGKAYSDLNDLELLMMVVQNFEREGLARDKLGHYCDNKSLVAEFQHRFKGYVRP